VLTMVSIKIGIGVNEVLDLKSKKHTPISLVATMGSPRSTTRTVLPSVSKSQRRVQGREIGRRTL
jgi:hypothetical protein